MNTGSIAFGPRQTAVEATKAAEQAKAWQSGTSVSGQLIQACNCISPQPGETKCPCALKSEMQTASKMLDEGVTIAGRKYRLVPAE